MPDDPATIQNKMPSGINLAVPGYYPIQKDRLGYLVQVEGTVGKSKNASISIGGYFPSLGLNFQIVPARAVEGQFVIGVKGLGQFGEGTIINAEIETDDPSTPVSITYLIEEKSLV